MYPADDLERVSRLSPDVAAGHGNGHPDTNGHIDGLPAMRRLPLGLVVSHPEAGVCVVSVAGELDALTAPMLTDCVRSQVTDGALTVVIDLEAVGFLGSAGLGSLLDSSQIVAAAASGSMLHLAGTSERAVRRPLEMVGLLPLFNVHATVDDALREITAGAADPNPADPSPADR
jgi:anti-anti-sigma factor